MKRVMKAIKHNDLLDCNKALLYHQGLWPGAGDPSGVDTASQWRAARRRWHGRLAFASPLFFLFVIYPATLIAYWGDVVVLVDVVAYSFTLAGYISRLACVVLRGDRMRTLTAHLEALCRRAHVPRDAAHAALRAQETERTARRVRRMLTALVVFLVVCVANITTFLPEVHRKKVLFSSAYFPYDYRTSPNYELTLAAWSLTWGVCGIGVISVEVLFIAVIFLLVGELRLLRIDIAHVAHAENAEEIDLTDVAPEADDAEIVVVPEEGAAVHHGGAQMQAPAQEQETALLTETQTEEDMERRLEECANRYQECIRMVGEVQDAFQWLLSTQIVCNVIPGVFSVVWATTAGDLGQKAPVLIELAAFSWLQLLVYCFLGDQIADESALVREAVYGCAWLRASDGFKRSMRIMMSRSNQPVEISVANFVPLTKETFLGMANMAYSYYIALRDIVKQAKE